VPISRSFPASDWQKARGDHAPVKLGLARLVNIRSCCSSTADTLVASAAIALCPIGGNRQKITVIKAGLEIPEKL